MGGAKAVFVGRTVLYGLACNVCVCVYDDLRINY